MADTNLDKLTTPEIMTPDEVAKFFQKSTSWVYKNCKELGGVKLGGSLFFPSREDLYERIFRKEQGVEVRLHQKGKQAHGSLVQNKKRRPASRGEKEVGTQQSITRGTGGDRHGLL